MGKVAEDACITIRAFAMLGGGGLNFHGHDDEPAADRLSAPSAGEQG